MRLALVRTSRVCWCVSSSYGALVVVVVARPVDLDNTYDLCGERGVRRDAAKSAVRQTGKGSP